MIVIVGSDVSRNSGWDTCHVTSLVINTRPGQGLGRLPPNGPHVGPAPTRALPLLDQHRFSTYSWEQMHAYFWLKVGFDKQNSYKNLIHDAPLGNEWKANKKLNQQTTLFCNLFLVCVNYQWCLKSKIHISR